MYPIVYGIKLYGRVDAVPGLFYVATKFFHIFWFPIVPLGTHIVVGETDEGWQGVPFGLSGRSVLAGYLRNLLIKGGIVSMVVRVIAAFAVSDPQHPLNALPLFGIGLVGVVLGMLSLLPWREATPERFEAICGALGIDPREPIAPEPSLPQVPGPPPAHRADPMVPVGPHPTAGAARTSRHGPHMNTPVPNRPAVSADGSGRAPDAFGRRIN